MVDGKGPMWAVLGGNQGLCGRSWKCIRAYVGGLGGGSGPMCAVLGADQGVGGRAWGRIRAYVGGLGKESWSKPEREGGLGMVSGRKVAQTQAGERSKRVGPPEAA